MNVEKLLGDYKKGMISLDKALKELKHLPFEDIGCAKIDHHRRLRTGFPEVVFCEGKTIAQVKEIFKKLSAHNGDVLLTRANEKVFRVLRRINRKIKYNKPARAIVLEKGNKEKKGNILLITAGTADIPVAEEAAVTAEIMGNKVEKVYDAGVAGIHRLLANKGKIETANVIIVVAGMEGALASVVGGLANAPIIAVPTSIGYGASFKGVAPLLTMMNSCAPGVAVVNIDNGFGAGYMASLINKR